MKKHKFADGGAPEGGRFDDDVYARARKFVEDNERRAGEGMANEEPSTPAPVKRSVKPAPSTPISRSAPAPTGRAEIPVGNDKAPPSDGSGSESDLERNLGAIGTAVGGLGALGGVYKMTKAAQKAREVARAGEKAREGLVAATRAGIADNRAQPARSTAGKVADLKEAFKSVPKRAAESKSKKAADEMAANRRRARTKDDSEAGVEFAKGGGVRGWGSARGARKAKNY